MASIIEKEVNGGGPGQGGPGDLQPAGQGHAAADGLDGHLRREADRNHDVGQAAEEPSPYNTYRYKGLPPGPISAPERPRCRAAQPENGKWLYFVTVNLDTGETKFATTKAEFDKNVDEFQAWCQANKGRCVS